MLSQHHNRIEIYPVTSDRLKSYESLEVSPVHSSREGTWRVDPPDTSSVTFWSVYGHHEGAECLADFPTETQAMQYAEALLAQFPNLKKHGIIKHP